MTTNPNWRIFIVTIFVPSKVPWLEYVNGLLRTPPAGLIGFVAAFCNEAKAESPRAAASAEAFRAHARPQPSSHARLSDLQRRVCSGRFAAFRGEVGKRGCADG
jgi:hypothetical protein